MSAPSSNAKGDDKVARTNLSLCGCLGYDLPYLIEWLEFHRLAGVERFFLYNNGDREAQRELLAPYVEEGTVTLHEWPVFPAPQMSAFKHCLDNHGSESRWIAFVDTDEFLFSPAGNSLSGVLRDYEQYPAVGVCRAFFGPSGQRAKPEGLVTESYTCRWTGWRGSSFVKSVIDPARTVRPVNPHYFRYADDARAVDELHRPVDGQHAQSVSYGKLRINHYFTRSEEEWLQKTARLRPDTGEPYNREWTVEHMREFDRDGELDETILPLVPAVREAVARRTDRSRV